MQDYSSEDFLHRTAPYLDWTEVSALPHLSEQFLTRYADLLSWRVLSKRQDKFTPSFLDQHAHRFARVHELGLVAFFNTDRV